MKIAVLSSTVVLAACCSHAATLVDWFTLDAGGGAQDSANYTINSTIGQGDVGAVAGFSASYQSVTGFWAVENFGPASGRPALSIAANGLDVIISWPSPSSGYVLEQTDSLDVLPAAWSTTGALVADDGVLKSVTLPHLAAKRFYRLRRN